MLVLSLLIGLLTLLLPVQGSDNGLTDKVSWDKYSLMIEGKRVYIFAGEFHYQRLPVPELWPDVFQKYKAHGLNAVRSVTIRTKAFSIWQLASNSLTIE